MKCREAKQYLQPYLDGGLDPARKKALESHLAACPACRDELETIKAVEAVSDMEFLPDPGAAYWQKLTRNLYRHSGDSQTSRRAPKRTRGALAIWRLAGPAAAVLLIFFAVRTGMFQSAGPEPREQPDPGSLSVRRALERADGQTAQTPPAAAGAPASDTARGARPPAETAYITAFEQVQNTADPKEQLRIWERFIDSSSDSFSIQRARFEQAFIHYLAARNSDSPAQIDTALAFFTAHRDLFARSGRGETIRAYTEKLKFLAERARD